MPTPRFRLSFPWFDRRAMPVLLGVVAGLYLLEEYFSLREQQHDKTRRSIINTALAATGFSVARMGLLPVMVWLAALSEQRRWGLANLRGLPRPLTDMLAFLLLDYSNYLWHRAMHRVPLLYRFHNIHHTDLDMDVTTGYRFHFGEQLLSILFRGGMVVIIGPRPALLLGYEAIFEGCTAFHHSNLRLPVALERVLSRLMITPRAHGIHHSIVEEEFDSNYGVIFTFWDRLHRTLRLHIPQEKITIGVPGWRDPEELTVVPLHEMPLEEQRPWRLPDGRVPQRPERERIGPPTHLAP